MIVEGLDPKSECPIRLPLSRVPRTDLVSPSFDDLFNLALGRVVDVVEKNQENPPPLLFPTAEHTQITYFPTDVWDKLGNMETEVSRLTFTLSHYPERGFPVTCELTIRNLLREERILDSWSDVVDGLRGQAQEAMRHALDKMVAQHPLEATKCNKEAFLTFPVDYATSDGVTELQVSLWKRALAETAEILASGKLDRVESLLQIHAFLRDPIGGLKTSSESQVSQFTGLLAAFQQVVMEEALSLESWQGVAAQLALESSFLAIPKLQKVTYIHFKHHQELPYVYVSLTKLPRAEFSVPKRVLDIVSELVLGSTKDDLCQMAPITIAYAAPLETHGKPFKIIIDGNNRVTALVLLKFLATKHQDELDDPDGLDTYCQAHNLGIKWTVDIRDVMEDMRNGNPCMEVLKARRDIVKLFAGVTRVPALVVQEPSFHTICMSRRSGPRPVLLQPMHQTLYNEESLCLAFAAQRGQAHGRPLSYKSLPLK